MSRTYRTLPIAFCNNCDKPIQKNITLNYSKSCDCGKYFSDRMKYGSYTKIVKTRDYKAWYKPPKKFKQIRQQRFRAQMKQALYNSVNKNKDYIPPINQKTDIWEWT